LDQHHITLNLLDIDEDSRINSERERSEVSRSLIADSSPVRGPQSAAVTIVEFSDFQCPFCKRFDGMYQSLPSEIRQKAKLVFKQYPLSMHCWARAAAGATICANFQSDNAFWELHDLLFSKQAEFNRVEFSAKLQALETVTPGIDVANILACSNSHR
jgi:protein-disulfide isomerase